MIKRIININTGESHRFFLSSSTCAANTAQVPYTTYCAQLWRILPPILVVLLCSYMFFLCACSWHVFCCYTVFVWFSLSCALGLGSSSYCVIVSPCACSSATWLGLSRFSVVYRYCGLLCPIHSHSARRACVHHAFLVALLVLYYILSFLGSHFAL